MYDYHNDDIKSISTMINDAQLLQLITYD